MADEQRREASESEAREETPSAAEQKRLDPLSTAVQAKKEDWYSRVNLTVKQLDVVIFIVSAALVIVVILMILEAAGIFKL